MRRYRRLLADYRALQADHDRLLAHAQAYRQAWETANRELVKTRQRATKEEMRAERAEKAHAPQT